MSPPDTAPADQLALVERARGGDRAAFVELYRQDAPPAWRLGLALTRDADAAGATVTEGFRRVLGPLRPGTATTELPFRLRLLTAVRHAHLDAQPMATGAIARPAAVPADEAPAALHPRQVMDAFYALPEQWRTILWLLHVEGLGTLDASRVLGLPPEAGEALAERALEGLREAWRTTHPGGPVPAHLERQLQPVLPLPLALFDATERAWARTRRTDAGPLGLTLPGGRAVPGWAERTLVGVTALLIAAGISGAILADRDGGGASDVRVARAPSSASGTDDEERGAGEDDPTSPPGDEPRRSFGDTFEVTDEDDDDGGPAGAGAGSGEGARSGLAAVGALAAPGAAPVVSPTRPSEGGSGGGASASPTTTTTAPPPLLQATVGLGDTLGVSVGDRCTGVELLGRPAGCPPETADQGLTLGIESRLLPGL